MFRQASPTQTNRLARRTRDDRSVQADVFCPFNLAKKKRSELRSGRRVGSRSPRFPRRLALLLGAKAGSSTGPWGEACTCSNERVAVNLEEPSWTFLNHFFASFPKPPVVSYTSGVLM